MGEAHAHKESTHTPLLCCTADNHNRVMHARVNDLYPSADTQCPPTPLLMQLLRLSEQPRPIVHMHTMRNSDEP